MSRVTQWEYPEFFLTGGDKLHFPLLLYTEDRCIEDLQQLKFVLDIISDCWIHISCSMQWKQVLQTYQNQAKVQKVPVASKKKNMSIYNVFLKLYAKTLDMEVEFLLNVCNLSPIQDLKN